jgi:hypothetical protein
VLEYLRQEASAPVTSSDSSTETREADASWIADAALTWLRRGWADADELAWELMGLARTQTAASGVREAALMHLGFCQVGAPMRQRIGSQLCALAAEPASFAWVGLALRLLGREVFVAEQPEWVRERCMELAADPQAHVLCRITAFDLAARRGWHEAEPLARLQAVSAPATGERVSALHVLAEVGNEDTLRWLEKWEPPADPFVAACLDATRERLRARGTTF